MHEGEKVEEHWDEDKYRMEQDVGRMEGDIADVKSSFSKHDGPYD